MPGDRDLRRELGDLKKRLADLAEDLNALEALVELEDVPSLLNKMRYITEKVLTQLCEKHEVDRGSGRSTLEVMKGPLIHRGVVPHDVAIHLNTIQTYTSPGSHYQRSPLSREHAHIAQLAFTNFLFWYHTQREGANSPQQADFPQRGALERQAVGRRLKRLVTAAALGLLVGVGILGWFTRGARLPAPAGADLGSRLADLPPTQRFAVAAGVDLELALVPSGHFEMGSPSSEAGRGDDEVAHEVIISAPFYLSTYEVTQAQFQAVMGKNPSQFLHPRNPVERVTWDEATAFCKALSTRLGKEFRLPTEAEWEYASRATTRTAYWFGPRVTPADACFGRSDGGPDRVASFAPNAWGLYDLHGSVWEWCADWYRAYNLEISLDPVGPAMGTLRVVRGGGWSSEAPLLRSAKRACYPPDARDAAVGFRVALSPLIGRNAETALPRSAAP